MNITKLNTKGNLGLGPAGRIVRIVWWYARAKHLNQKLVFDPYTAAWWSTCFKSVFFDVEPVEGIPERVEKDLKEMFPDRTQRESFIADAAQEILVLRDDFPDPLLSLPKEYYCVYRRGTDKITELPYYPVQLFVRWIKEWQKTQKLPLIGVSDSAYCLEELMRYFPDMLMTSTAKSTTEKPLHLHLPMQSQDDLIKEALLDALVISKSKSVVYSHSMMINLAKFLNPKLEMQTVEAGVDSELREMLKSVAQYICYRERGKKK